MNIIQSIACWLLNLALWLVEPILMFASLPRWLDRHYRIQVLLGKDQLGNAYAAGWADESISARAWRCRERAPWGALLRLIDTLFFWQDDHCLRAYMDELDRQQVPAQYREPT